MILQCYTKKFIELYRRALLFIKESRNQFVLQGGMVYVLFLRNLTSGLLTLNGERACNLSSLFIKTYLKKSDKVLICVSDTLYCEYDSTKC